ncbi:hypothetical protein LSTR_LSTR006415 [Laodelphax striatellus]|uniref:Uncharacterized protein n=1 Tax=Laodelphax striatellus TaxID=195883 RepID=A0A482WXF6_LAOST|nr:hypothetical protein LSTR_LSTR006415 [Laodelphax striatellus]
MAFLVVGNTIAQEPSDYGTVCQSVSCRVRGSVSKLSPTFLDFRGVILDLSQQARQNSRVAFTIPQRSTEQLCIFRLFAVHVALSRRNIRSETEIHRRQNSLIKLALLRAQTSVRSFASTVVAKSGARTSCAAENDDSAVFFAVISQ